jgi:hypothetical protein
MQEALAHAGFEQIEEFQTEDLVRRILPVDKLEQLINASVSCSLVELPLTDGGGVVLIAEPEKNIENYSSFLFDYMHLSNQAEVCSRSGLHPCCISP